MASFYLNLHLIWISTPFLNVLVWLSLLASVCGGLHKTEIQKVISCSCVPGVSPKDVLTAQVSGLDSNCKEFDVSWYLEAVSQLKCEQPSLATPRPWQPDNPSHIKINLLRKEICFILVKVILAYPGFILTVLEASRFLRPSKTREIVPDSN